MAYVHVSVNQKSKDYLANERRYNYTTPKSFLEQIKLYHSLLGQKSKDLTTKKERLENGLQKLNSTSTQVMSPGTNFKQELIAFFSEEIKTSIVLYAIYLFKKLVLRIWEKWSRTVQSCNSFLKS